MTFAVVYKGSRCYHGKLYMAYSYIEKTWGSRESAWELGVKIEPIAGR